MDEKRGEILIDLFEPDPEPVDSCKLSRHTTAMPPKLFLNVNASTHGLPGDEENNGNSQVRVQARVSCPASRDIRLHWRWAPLKETPSPGVQFPAPSIEIGPTGTLKLYKSFQAYEFNKQGMTRNTITSPLAAGAAALQQSYQVRPGLGNSARSAFVHPMLPFLRIT